MTSQPRHKPLYGICAALSTPLSADGSQVDTGRLQAHVDEIIEAGVHGIAPCSGTGEYAYLSDEERRLVIEVGARQAAGRVPVIAQASGMSTAEVIEKARHAEAQGVDALMILPPYLEVPGPRAIIRHYEMIARAVSTPIVMYNVPFHAAEVTEDMYRELIAIENLDYIKDSSGDFFGLQKLLGVGGQVFTGIDAFAPYAFLAGCPGMIWGAANFMPHECVALYDHIMAGEIAEAMALWECMKGICMWLGGNRHDVGYIAGVKAAARITGRDLGPARRPLPPVPGPARHDIRLALAKLPVNNVREDSVIWRNWQEERDWFVQINNRPTHRPVSKEGNQ